MSDQNPSHQPTGEKSSLASGTRLGAVVVVLLVVAGGAYYINQATLPQSPRDEIYQASGMDSPVQNRLHERFADADKDLVADPPADKAKLIDPEVIRFSYVAHPRAEAEAKRWQAFVEALGKAVGKKAEYLVLTSSEKQLEALKDRQLHVTGLNTGAVPVGVNAAGFVPVCSPGDDQGRSSYKMQIIVPSSSDITEPADLKDHTIALTHHKSNAGYKAPLVLLQSDFGLKPGHDYDFTCSRSYANSMEGVVAGRFEAAAIASDLLAAAIQKGRIKLDKIRVIYESEPFPKACLGYVNNLRPELAGKIKDFLLAYNWENTPLQAEFAPDGATKFVPVSYKDDWSLVRRIDDALGIKHVIGNNPTPAVDAKAGVGGKM